MHHWRFSCQVKHSKPRGKSGKYARDNEKKLCGNLVGRKTPAKLKKLPAASLKFILEKKQTGLLRFLYNHTQYQALNVHFGFATPLFFHHH